MLQQAIDSGEGTMVLRLDALGGAPDQGSVAATISMAQGTLAKDGTLVAPGNNWSTYVWHPLAPWDNPAIPGVPQLGHATWSDGWMVGRTWVSGQPIDLPLRLPSFWGKGADLRLTLHRAIVSATISADGTSAKGRIGGIVKPYELISAISLASFGGICDGGPGQSCEKAMLLQFVGAADMISDGTQDPTRECDGISFGATFEATASTLSSDEVSVPLPSQSCWCVPLPRPRSATAERKPPGRQGRQGKHG